MKDFFSRNDSEADASAIHILSEHVVAFVDVLGQSKLLSQMAAMPKTEEEIQEFAKLFRESGGAVKAFRNGFLNLIDSFNHDSFTADNFDSEETYKSYSALRKCRLNPFSFSDFVIINTSLRDLGINCPLIDLSDMLLACSAMFILMLAVGKPVRGGISVGPAFEGTLYGYPYWNAYEMESHCAQWPRIVVSERLIQYVESAESVNQSEPRFRAVATFKDKCSKLLSQDGDGQYILDYLGVGHRNILASNPSILEMLTPQIHTGFEFAKKQRLHFIKCRDATLAGRYSMLCDYLESRLHLWPFEG